MQVYNTAVKEKYRFFSFGDSCFFYWQEITKKTKNVDIFLAFRLIICYNLRRNKRIRRIIWIFY
jgi:hypothetical protein